MRKALIILITLFLISNISAEVIITEQPNNLYNRGDILVFTIKVNALEDIDSFLSINLICPEKQTEIHKEYIYLESGEEKKIDSIVPLILDFIGESNGNCKIKINLEERYVLSEEFSLSNFINVDITSEKTEFNPEEILIVEGTAIKENGNPAEGFVNITLTHETTLEKIKIKDTVKTGYFYVDYKIPKNTKAGNYNIKIDVYEKYASGLKSNYGFTESSTLIKQIPTNLEILLETNKVEPGTNLKVKTILHDQSGELIESNSLVTIKNNEKEIIKQEKVKTGENLEIPIKYNEPSNNWEINAKSGEITNNLEFEIIEKENVEIKLLNKTIILTNKGNIPYNNTIAVKVGENTTFIDAYLKIDQSKKYKLTAPDGKYNILIESEGKEKFSRKEVMLTGNAISIKESGNFIEVIKHPFVWVFMIAILGFVAFTIFKKGYKRSFFGYTRKLKEKKNTSRKKETSLDNIKREKLLNLTENKAELSLSIKGEKQKTIAICLRLKNMNELISKKNAINEIFRKIIKEAEIYKSYIYESQNNIFFLFSPLATKTFKNEKPALELAEKIKRALDQHNKLFKQKIDYGISTGEGEIIARVDSKNKKMQFMGVGKFIQEIKKISSLSEKEIFLTENLKNKLSSEFKTEKKTIQGTEVYRIKEIINKEKHKKFLDSFLKRIEN